MSPESATCGKTDAREARAAGHFDPDPVTRGTVQRSRMGRRRALVLLGIHVLAFIHILWWKLRGEKETLSPVEPSEGLYTVANGVLNAGAILLVLSMLATMVVGRFFCGWACHLVALQDGCAWILKKIGVRPRPLRSRWLVLIPLGAGIYLFFWPEIRRWFRDDIPRPELTVEMTKSDFWATFPDFWIALLTFLVCGFGMVYLLGAKGFCTYACPYGGLFGVADRFSPLRIRVNDACKACGHCTSVCTSNVEVAHEVHRYGAVVDPGCMKCLDCVSVCPENALSLGFGRPAILTKERKPARGRRRAILRFGEEILVFVVFAFTLLILMGLPHGLVIGGEELNWATEIHGLMPLLFGLGLSASSGFLALFCWRLYVRKNVTFHRFTLKDENGIKRAGFFMLVVIFAWFALLALMALFQSSMWRGDRAFGHLDPAAMAATRRDGGAIDPSDEADLKVAIEHFKRAESLRIFPDIRPSSRLAGAAFASSDWDGAIKHFKNAIAIEPEYADSWLDLSRVYAAKGDGAEALRALHRADELARDRMDILGALFETQRALNQGDAAAVTARRIITIRQDNGETTTLAPAFTELGLLQARQGDRDAAKKSFLQALEYDSNFVAAEATLGHLASDAGDWEEAARRLKTASAAQPFDFNIRYAYRRALRQLGREELAAADVQSGILQLESALKETPQNYDLLLYLAAEEMQVGRIDAARVKVDQILKARPNWEPALALKAQLAAPQPPR